jgi:hypothetical protein
MHRIDEMHTIFWFENLKVRDCSKDTGIDGKKILDLILGKWGGKVLTGCFWLRIGTSGGLQVPQNTGNFLTS